MKVTTMSVTQLFGSMVSILTIALALGRFYIMQLPHRGLQFDRITFHANVTQCLGALALLQRCIIRAEEWATATRSWRSVSAASLVHAGSFAPDPWYLVVAAATGSVDKPPVESDLHAFRVRLSGACGMVVKHDLTKTCD